MLRWAVAISLSMIAAQWPSGEKQTFGSDAVLSALTDGLKDDIANKTINTKPARPDAVNRRWMRDADAMIAQPNRNPFTQP